MINEEFDDDIPDEVEIDRMMEAGTPVEIVTKKPTGDFSRSLGGRLIWFNAPIPGQFHAWRRHRDSLIKRFEKLKARARNEATLELLRELSETSEKLDTMTLELVESLMVNEDDIDFVALEMIAARVTMADIYQVLFGEPEPDDDEIPAPAPPKKKIPKKVTAAKKSAANAKRTQR